MTEPRAAISVENYLPAEICALLGYHTALSGRFLCTDVLTQPVGTNFKCQAVPIRSFGFETIEFTCYEGNTCSKEEGEGEEEEGEEEGEGEGGEGGEEAEEEEREEEEGEEEEEEEERGGEEEG
jgi:hypothetical protein